MSLSWTFLTKSFLTHRYRDYIAMICIGKFAYNKYVNYVNDNNDSMRIMSRVYTTDESDVEFRETYNMTDAAVRRDKTLAFAQMIKEERAKKEREMMLDAFNYLN